MGSKPHAVLIPAPAQGHIKTMLKQAKLLHYEGFHITFVNTEFNRKRFVRARRISSNNFPNFTSKPFLMASLHQILMPPKTSPLSDSINNYCSAPFLLAKLDAPPVTAIVSNVFMPFTVTAAQEHEVPPIMFVTMSAYGFMGIKQLRVMALNIGIDCDCGIGHSSVSDCHGHCRDVADESA